MRIGVNLLCAAGHVDAATLPLARRAAELGYDGVEIPVLEGAPAHYAWLGRELDAMGLARTTVSVVPSPDANPLSDDPETRRRGRAHLDWALDCAAALGAESLGGPLHAPLGWFPGRPATDSERDRAVEAYGALAERAAAAGLYLSVEPLNRFETYFLNTAEQARALADRVGHPAFRVMHDTFHANIEERDPVAAVGTLAGRLGVVHISENDRGVPGRGHIDFDATLRALRRAGFDGWLVVEAFGDALPALAAATRVWRPLFPDVETLLAESVSLLRAGWDRAGA